MSSILKNYFVFIFLFSYTIVNGQSIDYHNVYQTKKLIAKDSAKNYCNFLIRSDKTNQKAFGYSSMAYLIALEKGYKTADSLFEQASIEIQKIKLPLLQKEETMYFLANQVSRLLHAQELEEVIPLITEGKQLAKNLDNKRMTIRFDMLLGSYYSLSGLYLKSYTYGKNALELIGNAENELSEQDYIDFTLKTLSNTTARAKNYYAQDTIVNKAFLDSAQYYNKRNIDFLNKFNIKSPRKKLFASNMRGEIYFSKKLYDSSLYVFQQTVKLAALNAYHKTEFQLKFRIAECYYFKKDYQKALQSLNVIDDESLKKYKLLTFIYKKDYYLFKIYKNLGDYDQAFHYADKRNESYTKFRDSKDSTLRDALTYNMLDSENKEIENYLKQNSELQTKNYKLQFFATLFLIVCLFVILKYYNHKKKSKLKLQRLIEEFDRKKVSSFKNITKERILENENSLSEENAHKIMKHLLLLEEDKEFLKNSFNINTAAKKIKTNTTYLSRFVNEHLGKSFVDYTNDLRVTYVIDRLQTDRNFRNYTIKAIANEAGYKSAEALNRNFKKVTQVYPSQFIRTLKKTAS